MARTDDAAERLGVDVLQISGRFVLMANDLLDWIEVTQPGQAAQANVR